MIPGAACLPAVALQTKVSLFNKSSRSLGSMSKISICVLAISRMHESGSVQKNFGECHWSTVLLSALSGPLSHCIPPERFVSVHGVT